MSNDRDGVSEDGHDALVGTPPDEATEASGVVGGNVVDGSLVDGGPNGTEPDSAEPDSAVPDRTVSAGEAAAAGSSPLSAGSARAAARRSAARAAVSEGKGAPTPRRAPTTTEKRPNVLARFGRFLREVVAELRKVIWPTRNQMVTYTIVVIAFVAFMVALVGVLDLLFAKGVLAVFG